MRRMIYSFLAILWAAACSNPINPVPYVEEPVVQGLLLVGEPIRNFHVERTLPLTAPYDSARAGITDAQIVIWSDRGDTARLSPVPFHPGNYEADSSFIIQPRTTYRLHMRWRDRVIEAATTTPGVFRMLTPSDSLVFALDEFAEVKWTASEGAVGYYVTVTNYEENPLPIDRPFRDQDPFAERRTRIFWTLESRLELYSFLHNFYGVHELQVFAADENFFKYVQSSFQDPRELNEPDFSVSNAIGYFGSAAMQSMRYTLVQSK